MDEENRRLGGGKRQIAETKPVAHAFVATPAYDDRVYSQYAQSLAETSFRAPFHQIMVTQTVMANGCFIELARNIFAKMFLEKFEDCTHLFFIDSDLKWPADAFIGLVQADLPICAGIYPRRQDPIDFPVHFMENPNGGGLWVETTQPGLDWFMADRVPAGFLCIRRDIVEEMAAEAPQLDIHGQDGPVPELFATSYSTDDVRFEGSQRFVGEDYYFCDKYVEKYGRPIHVYPNIDFKHGAQQIGVEGNLLNWVAENADPQDVTELREAEA